MPTATRKTTNSLAALRTKLEKKYGENRVMRKDRYVDYDIIPTGSMSLDHALKTGGFVRGRMHEIVGQAGVGKSSLVITAMAEAQKKYSDLAVGYIDMEQTFDLKWAEKLGLNIDDNRFLHIYPDDSEDVSDQLKALAETGQFSMIVLDSIGGMESKKALEKNAEDVTMGKNAQVITRMVKNTAKEARLNNVAVVFVNQYRANLAYAGSDISAGPKALAYANSIRIEMKRTGTPQLKYGSGDAEKPVGTEIRAKVSKNKLAAPGESGTFWLINVETDKYGPIGIDRVDEAVTIGKLSGVIKQRGGYYDLPGEVTLQGLEAVKGHLREHKDQLEDIRRLALATVASEVVENVESSMEEEVA